jgi:hypothetical protein
MGRSSHAGLPGQPKFYIPALDKDAELSRSLVKFTERLVGCERTDPSKRHSHIIKMATQALALLASTEKTNVALGRALKFIEGASTLQPSDVKEGMKEVVNHLVCSLFAHNGSIFQGEYIANSRGPTLRNVLKDMTSRHTRALSMKTERDSLKLDFAPRSQCLKTQPTGVETYRERELNTNGQIGDRVGDRNKKRRSAKSVAQPAPPPGPDPSQIAPASDAATVGRREQLATETETPPSPPAWDPDEGDANCTKKRKKVGGKPTSGSQASNRRSVRHKRGKDRVNTAVLRGAVQSALKRARDADTLSKTPRRKRQLPIRLVAKVKRKAASVPTSAGNSTVQFNETVFILSSDDEAEGEVDAILASAKNWHRKWITRVATKLSLLLDPTEPTEG